MESVLKRQGCTAVACFSDPNTKLKVGESRSVIPCSFIESALSAWAYHHPFRFRAEHIWLLILQAVAAHVDQNAEALRNKFVKHSGKMTLTVELPAEPTRKEWAESINE